MNDVRDRRATLDLQGHADALHARQARDMEEEDGNGDSGSLGEAL